MSDISTADSSLSPRAMQLLAAGLKFPGARAAKDQIFGLGRDDLIAAAIHELQQRGHLQEHWQLQNGCAARYFIFSAVPLMASGNPLHIHIRRP